MRNFGNFFLWNFLGNFGRISTRHLIGEAEHRPKMVAPDATYLGCQNHGPVGADYLASRGWQNALTKDAAYRESTLW